MRPTAAIAALRPALNRSRSSSDLETRQVVARQDLIDAIWALDTPAILCVTLFVAIVYVIGNLLVDIVQATIDPRIRVS